MQHQNALFTSHRSGRLHVYQVKKCFDLLLNISENNIPDTNVKLIAIAAYHKYEMEYQDASGGLNQIKRNSYLVLSLRKQFTKNILHILHHIMLYYVILYYIILYYTLLYYIILYYIMYFMVACPT